MPSNRPKDFFAKQIRSSHLIASGGIINPSSDNLSEELAHLRLMIYPKDALETVGPGGITYLDGAFEGIVPPALLNDPVDIGTDVWLFVSGSQGVPGSEVNPPFSNGTVLFGGDVYVSGTLRASTIEFEFSGVDANDIRSVREISSADAVDEYTNPYDQTEFKIELGSIIEEDELDSINYFFYITYAEGENLLIELPPADENFGKTFIIKDSLGILNETTNIRIAPKDGEFLDQYAGWVYGESAVTIREIDGDEVEPLHFHLNFASLSAWSNGTKWFIS